jgi:autotransporter passenger strand-loop-strand repeat protein
MTKYTVSSGTTSGITVSSGSVMSVFDSGTAKNIKVVVGGVISAYDGGVTSGINLSAHPPTPGPEPTEYVFAGGTSYNTTETVGTEIVAGGRAFNTKLQDISFLIVSNGGVAVSTTIRAGGTVSVTDGTVSATKILANSTLIIFAGSVATDTIVSGGGYNDGGDVVGGVTSFTQVTSGYETIRGGSSYNTTLKSDGLQIVSGGAAYNTTVSQGGTLDVYRGGSWNSIIKAGAFENVFYGGKVHGVTIDGGQLTLNSGAILDQSIKFSGSGGILSIGEPPAGEISGFTSGDDIQLTDIAYAKSDRVSVNTPGIVTVSAGGKTYDLNIQGATVGETDFVFGPGSNLTKSAAPQMAILRPPANAPAGLGSGYSGITSAASLTAADFAPKIAGGMEANINRSQFNGLLTEKVQSIQMGIPICISQSI